MDRWLPEVEWAPGMSSGSCQARGVGGGLGMALVGGFPIGGGATGHNSSLNRSDSNDSGAVFGMLVTWNIHT